MAKHIVVPLSASQMANARRTRRCPLGYQLPLRTPNSLTIDSRLSLGDSAAVAVLGDENRGEILGGVCYRNRFEVDAVKPPLSGREVAQHCLLRSGRRGLSISVSKKNVGRQRRDRLAATVTVSPNSSDNWVVWSAASWFGQ